MTPNQLTSLLAENLDRELDIPFQLQLYERVKVWRSRLIANSLQKDPLQRKFFRQTLYLDLKEDSLYPCDILIRCNKAVSILDVPLVVRAGTILFDYVGGIDGKSPYQELTPGTANYLSESPYSSLFPKYEYTNRKLAVSVPDLPIVRVDAIWDDPQLIDELNAGSSCAANTDCDFWNKEFPMSGDLTQLVIQSILQIDFNRKEEASAPEVKV